MDEVLQSQIDDLQGRIDDIIGNEYSPEAFDFSVADAQETFSWKNPRQSFFLCDTLCR